MSRDWVIDKLVLNVTYDTDVEKVRKIVKKVSAEVMEDPELAQYVLDPLKSQGIFAMGDFGLQLRTKITTLPGQQFLVRRAILAKIKSEFERNGVHFALSNVAMPAVAHLPPPANPQKPPEDPPAAASPPRHRRRRRLPSSPAGGGWSGCEARATWCRGSGRSRTRRASRSGSSGRAADAGRRRHRGPRLPG